MRPKSTVENTQIDDNFAVEFLMKAVRKIERSGKTFLPCVLERSAGRFMVSALAVSPEF